MNYVLTFVVLVLALVGAAVWTTVDELRLRRSHGSREYRSLYAWLRLFLRFTLAITLLQYGFVKVFPGQFGVGPRLADLNETYGQSSPMHVLWFFMGLSRPYTIFGGMMELIPGMLLLFRRTSTVGLLGAVAVMSNVVAMNFCYDVPVKLYSTHLLLMALFLLLPDVVPMWHFFFARHRALLTGVWVKPFERRALRIAAHVLQGLIVIAAVWGGVQQYRSRELAPIPSPLRGMWSIDAVHGWPHSAEGEPKTLVLDNNSSMRVITASGKRNGYSVKYNKQERTLIADEAESKTALRWTNTDVRSTTLTGTWMEAPVELRMHRTDPDTYPLMTRGFHWVQESAFNR